MQQSAARPDNSTLSAAGIAGLMLAGMLLLGFALDLTIIATTGGPPLVQLASLHADIARLRGNAIWPVDTWVYALSIVPFAIFVVGIRSALHSAGQARLADVGALGAILFQLVHTIHNLALLGTIGLLAQNYVSGSPEAAAAETVSRGLLGFAYAAFEPGIGVGTPLLVISMLAFAAAQRCTSASWSSRLALISAALLALGSLQLFVPAAVAIALIGWIFGIAWTIVTSVGMLTKRGHPAEVLLPQPV